MHSCNHDRARDAGVTSGGRAEVRPHPGADPSESRAGHERADKEPELTRPNDVRFTTAATLTARSQGRAFQASKRSQRRCVEATGVSRMQRSNPDGDTG